MISNSTLINRLHRCIGAIRPGEKFAFSMCNPPFFSDLEEACQNPRTVCTGTPNELVTAGGEVSFIERMIGESQELGHTVRYTVHKSFP